MLRLWAPLASSVRLEINGGVHELTKAQHGWWSSSHHLHHGDFYTFEVNGTSGLPDPRSPWQPEGVHGRSCYVDHSRFEWNDARWQQRPLSSAIIYELHIGTFTSDGTFDAAIEKLDHLVNLGITHVEVMPIAAFQGEHGWGYDGAALFAPHHPYGGPEALKRFVNACHQRGIAVLLDVVYNHLGPTGNYLPKFGPYFSERHNTPWGSALNFDGPDSDEVRRFFCDNALMWLRDYHIDGLRLDAVHAIIDTSAIPFLEQLASEVDALRAHLGRHFVLIAESDLNDPRVIRSPELGGYGLDAQWSDDIHHSLHSLLTGERDGYYEDFGTLEHVATSLRRPFVYAGRHSSHRRRSHGRPPVGLHGHRFVAYLQNHDQLGNRAHGERLCNLASLERVKIGAALILTSPYIPMLFQGEEWAAKSPFLYFVDFSDEPDLARSVAEGRCKEFSAFGWEPGDIPDPTDDLSFHKSKLNWAALSEDQHSEMLRWHKSLIAIRSQLSELTSGRLDLTASRFSAEEQWLEVMRGPIRILANFSSTGIPFSINDQSHVIALSSNPACRVIANELHLEAESIVILATQQIVDQLSLPGEDESVVKPQGLERRSRKLDRV